jgi:sterol desaturase/sphingolipid hydroxylase (fatty acid hydroxylase superfamily)
MTNQTLVISSEYRLLAPLWDYLYANHKAVIGSPLFHHALIVMILVVANTIYSIFDHYKLFNKRKLQPEKYPSAKARASALLNVCLTQGLIFFPMAIIPVLLGVAPEVPRHAPLVSEFVFDFILMTVLQDTLFYWTHRFLFHSKWVYKHVHSHHHAFHAPHAVSAQAAHPFESVIGAAIIFVPGTLVARHQMTVWIQFGIAEWYSIESHSGYNSGLFGFLKGIVMFAPGHDYHHKFVAYNFGGYFSFWDRFFGTYVDPSKHYQL